MSCRRIVRKVSPHSTVNGFRDRSRESQFVFAVKGLSQRFIERKNIDFFLSNMMFFLQDFLSS